MMMNDQAVSSPKTALDALLGASPAYVGIAFGHDLYEAFWNKGYIQPALFEAVGFPSIKIRLAAYGESRYAFCDLSLPLDQFVVGKAA